MNRSLLLGAFLGLLQSAVPFYGLRLKRLFGTRQVGWALVGAFSILALSHLASGWQPAGVRSDWELTRNLIYAIIPVLLLIGMMHIEDVFRERSRVEGEEKLRRRQLEALLDRRAEQIAEIREEYDTELARRDVERTAITRIEAPCLKAEKLELMAQVAAAAGQQLNRQAAVLKVHTRVLLRKRFDARTTGHHERIAEAVHQTAMLAQALLACGGHLPMRSQPLSLSNVLQQQTPRLRQLSGQGIVLQTLCLPDLPLVLADAGVLELILEELVRNASQAMTGSGSIQISADEMEVDAIHARMQEGAHAGRFVCLTVSDTGPGMDEQVQKHLGEPFFTTKDSIKTPGLGLASVYGLAKELGGWVQVKSRPQQGTSVRVFFPLAS
jgi:signal transduction histidine kinase